MRVLEKNRLTFSYLNSRYSVELKPGKIWVSPLDENIDFKDFLLQEKITSWSMLTSDNPYSTPVSDEANRNKRQELISLLESKGLKYWSSIAIANDKSWGPESGYFIANISREAALKIARDFQQNAIVTGGSDGLAEIVWTI